MNIFSVWWFDLILGIVFLLEIVMIFVRRLPRTRVCITGAALLLQLAAFGALFFIGTLDGQKVSISEVLLVLMIFAFVALLFSMLDNALDKRKAKKKAKKEEALFAAKTPMAAEDIPAAPEASAASIPPAVAVLVTDKKDPASGTAEDQRGEGTNT